MGTKEFYQQFTSEQIKAMEDRNREMHMLHGLYLAHELAKKELGLVNAFTIKLRALIAEKEIESAKAQQLVDDSGVIDIIMKKD
jgi:hypothetical protein